jgi:serine/threonine protein kinase
MERPLDRALLLLCCCCCCLSPAQAPHISHRLGADGDAAAAGGGSSTAENQGVDGGGGTTRVLTLPLSRTNILALSVLLVFSILGCVFLWKLVTRKKCNCKLCNQQYLIQEAIGSGGYGTVFTVKRTEDDTVLVLKKIRVDDITDANFAQAEARELRMLKHPRIVGYSDDFIHVEFMSGMQGQLDLEPLFFLVIVMEYCPEGDLAHRIADAYGRDTNSSEDEVDEDELSPLPDGPEHQEVVLPEPLVLKWVSEMADAMAYVHNANIIHRDIKSPNFFLVNDRVLLGDFGLCRRAVTQTITVGGTDVYMAPEMVMGQRYGKEADMWAIGCVIFELCSGKFMWEIPGILGAQASASPDATQKLLNVVSTGYSKELIDIISSLLTTNPAQRPTAEDVLEIPAVKKAHEKDRQAWIAEGGMPSPLRRASSARSPYTFLPGCLYWPVCLPEC